MNQNHFNALMSVILVAAFLVFVGEVSYYYEQKYIQPQPEISGGDTVVNADLPNGGGGGGGMGSSSEAVQVSLPCGGQEFVVIQGGWGVDEYITADHHTFTYYNGICTETADSKACAKYWDESMQYTPVMCAKYFGF